MNKCNSLRFALCLVCRRCRCLRGLPLVWNHSRNAFCLWQTSFRDSNYCTSRTNILFDGSVAMDTASEIFFLFLHAFHCGNREPYVLVRSVLESLSYVFDRLYRSLYRSFVGVALLPTTEYTIKCCFLDIANIYIINAQLYFSICY